MTRPGARGFQGSKVTSSHRENAKRRGAGRRQNPQHHAAFNSLLAYPRLTTKIHEWRIDEAMTGKLPDLHNRFANHTLRLFEKHGSRILAIGRKSSALVTGSYTSSATPAWETGKRAGQHSRLTRAGSGRERSPRVAIAWRMQDYLELGEFVAAAAAQGP
jgi:hypothetical protein